MPKVVHPLSVYSVRIAILGARGPGVDSRDIIKELKRDGWYEADQAGSHKQFKHPKKKGRVTVPHPKRDIPIGTLKSIEKQAGIKLS
jgi:predicted RNA binding protein YcfA (HicA-like mRNA interferase family)